MTEQELCMRHQGGYQKKVDCWFCKSEEEQAKIMERIFKTKQEEIREEK